MDQLNAWIEHLPFPAWLLCVLGIPIVAALANAAFWIDGSSPFGSFESDITIFAVFVFYWPALYGYLTRVGSRALATFRPLLELDDAGMARLDRELGTLPRLWGWLSLPLGLIFAAASILGDPAPYGDLVPRTALPYIVDIIVTGFMAAAFFSVIIRSARQLRMIHRLHRMATGVDLLKLRPAHAFSSLTARTGIGLMLVLILGYLMNPQSLGVPLQLLTYLVTAGVAIAVFAIPLMGMRDRLKEEKLRMLNQLSDVLKTATDALHVKVTGKDYRELKELQAGVEALMHERELYSKVPTWPWDPASLRGFASALLLPIVLWLITRLLERAF
jgi:hypothetical protein